MEVTDIEHDPFPHEVSYTTTYDRAEKQRYHVVTFKAKGLRVALYALLKGIWFIYEHKV